MSHARATTLASHAPREQSLRARKGILTNWRRGLASVQRTRVECILLERSAWPFGSKQTYVSNNQREGFIRPLSVRVTNGIA